MPLSNRKCVYKSGAAAPCRLIRSVPLKYLQVFAALIIEKFDLPRQGLTGYMEKHGKFFKKIGPIPSALGIGSLINSW